MVVLAFVILGVVWFLTALMLDVKKIGRRMDWSGGMVGAGIVTVISFAIFIVVNSVGYLYQVYGIEDYTATQHKIKMYEEKTDLLTLKFNQILAEKYPEHEKKLFDGMTPESVEILLVKYPEIRASETSIELVNQLLRLNNEIYREKEHLIDLVRDANYRRQNGWYMRFIIPKVPEHMIY